MSLLLIILIVLIILLLAQGNTGNLSNSLGNINWNDSKTWLVVLAVVVIVWLLFFRSPVPEHFRRVNRMNSLPHPIRMRVHAEEAEEEHKQPQCPYEPNGDGNGYPMW